VNAARQSATAVAETHPSPDFRDVVGSEWLKARTLRSSRRVLLLAVIVVVGVSAISCAVTANHWRTHFSPGDRANFDPVLASFNGWYIGQLLVGTLGVLAITNEYGNGMITLTLAATPHRLRMMGAKYTVVGATALAVGEVTSLAAFWIGQALLTPVSIGVSLHDPGVALAVFGSGVYVTLIALLGLGIGALVRSTAGGVATLLGLLFLPPVLADAFPPGWHDLIQRYSPLNAGSRILTTAVSARALSPLAGLGVLALYVAVAVILGTAVLQRRDA
jgi:ABC-2 type transport system permease protein